MENNETFNTEIIEDIEQTESTFSELTKEETATDEEATHSLENGEGIAENESAQSIETIIDYSETLTLIYSEIHSVNYLMTVILFLQLFIWVESKVNHIVRSVSNKWKV